MHILYLFLFLPAAISTGPSIIRCYCNLPECTDTSYSCISRTGCFQELPHYNFLPQPLYRRLSVGKGQAVVTPAPNMDLRFGCLELWPSDSAPFQCTEPGSRKSPLTDTLGNRRHPSDRDYDDETDQFISRPKHGDRTAGIGRRRASGNRHHHNNKAPESRRWNAYDVPLRCCKSDMCNRRSAPSAPRFPIPVSTSTPRSTADSKAGLSSTSEATVSVANSQQWWFTSTMIFVPVIGGITFFLLVVVGCWILHYGGSSPCRSRSRSKLALNGTSVTVPAHYYFYDTSGVKAVLNGDSMEKGSSIKPCKCLVVETASADLPRGRCVHVLPIFLSKHYDFGDGVRKVTAVEAERICSIMDS